MSSRGPGYQGLRHSTNEDEMAFYGAVETNDSTMKVFRNEALHFIARELVDPVRRNDTID